MTYDNELPQTLLGEGLSATSAVAPAAPITDPATDDAQHGDQTSQASRPGAQPANRNALRFGLRTSRLPAGCGHVANATNALRLALEDAVTAQHGAISVYRAALIQSAVRHETRAMLLARRLRLSETSRAPGESVPSSGSQSSKPAQSGGLDVQDYLAILRDISSATDSRDRCLERLKLDQEPRQTLVAQLYGGRT